MNSRSLLVSSFLLFLGLSPGAAWAAASAPPALTLLNASAQAKAAATAARDTAIARQTQLQALVQQRKQAQTALEAVRRELKQHETSAAGAFKKYQTAEKAGKVGAADLTQLETAHTEYAAALATGATLVKDTAALRALDARLAKLATDASDAAASAKRAASDAATSSAQLKALTKTEADAAQKAAQTAGTAATQLTAPSKLPSKGYLAFQAKAKHDDDALKQAVAAAHSGLASTKGPPKPAPIQQCDLRKVDWKNFSYDGVPALKDGQWSEQVEGDEGRTENFAVGDVDYFDLDGDGSVEAIVAITYASLGMTAHEVPSLHVMSRDKTCVVFEAGSLQGMGMCSELGREGRKLVQAGCGEPRVEYQLVRGELKETKRTPAQ
ncbi:MAG: hypothetical protein ABW061_19515 [Polyangiaceae bacterium]